MKNFLTVLLLAGLAAPAAAQMYRWVDENGQVHYTQTPPSQRRYSEVAPAPPPSAAPNQDALGKALQADVDERPKREQAAAQAAAEQARKQANCKQATERLRFLDERTAYRLMVKDKNGAPARMTEEQFQAERAEAQKRIGANC